MKGERASDEFFDPTGIYFASRNPVAFSVKLEVMNERLHRELHLGAARGNDLGINEMGRTQGSAYFD